MRRVVGPVEFVEMYERASTTAELAEKLDWTPGQVMGRASMYRKAGVKLKRMQMGRPRLEVEKLNEMIGDIQKTQPVQPVQQKRGIERIREMIARLEKQAEEKKNRVK